MRQQQPATRIRRAVALLLFTVVVPGSAQLTVGNRRVGRVALRVWLGLIAMTALLVVLTLVARPFVFGLLTRPGILSLIAVACWVGAVVWPLLVADAWRLGNAAALPLVARRWIAVLAVLLLALTSVPLFSAGRRAWAAGDLIGSVFGAGAEADATDGRYTVLLLGGDAGPTRVGTRPDSITLASIDAKTGSTVLFGLPRNLQDVPFLPGTPAARAMPNGWSCGDDCLLNGLYTYGHEHPELYPGAGDPGAQAVKESVQAVLGVTVNYYVLIDLSGFRSLIDAMGGIDLTVAGRVPIGGGTSPVWGYIEPGRRHLNGFHALWFARSREGASDYARMARQRCVMKAMLDQLDPTTVLARFQRIAAAGKDVVSTDIPASQLGTFIELGTKAKGQRISSVQFVPPLVKPAYPDFALIRAKVTASLDEAQQGSGSQGAAGSGTAKGAGSAQGSGAAQNSGTPKAGTGRSSPAAPSGTPQAEVRDVANVCSAG